MKASTGRIQSLFGKIKDGEEPSNLCANIKMLHEANQKTVKKFEF